MASDAALLRDLLCFTRDGEWGPTTPSPHRVPYTVIRGGDFPEARHGDLSSVPTCYLDPEAAARKQLTCRDIVIETAGGNRDRPTGRTLLITEDVLRESALPVTCASFSRLMRVDAEKAEAEYVFWYLQYLFEQGEMWQHQVQHTGVARFQFTRFAETVSIPLRRRSEQREIGRILGLLERKIAHNRRMNQTLEALARALFKSWFVDFDPVVAKAAGKKPVGMSTETAALFPDRFQDSALGPIPKGWTPSSVASVAKYVNGRNFTKNATGTGRMVLRIAELNSGAAGSTVYNDVVADRDNLALPDDILFAWSGSLDVYRWHGEEGLVNQHIFNVMTDSLPRWFVYYHLREAMPFFQGIAADKATTMGHIKREHLSQAELALPMRSVINATDRIIRPLYDRVHRQERQNRSLAALRDALLPELMSGELRVRQAAKLVEEVGA